MKKRNNVNSTRINTATSLRSRCFDNVAEICRQNLVVLPWRQRLLKRTSVPTSTYLFLSALILYTYFYSFSFSLPYLFLLKTTFIILFYSIILTLSISIFSIYTLLSIPVVSAATSARPFCRGSFGIFAV